MALIVRRFVEWHEEHWEVVDSAAAVAGALLVSVALATAFSVLTGATPGRPGVLIAPAEERTASRP